jgi:hypothetical protein
MSFIRIAMKLAKLSLASKDIRPTIHKGEISQVSEIYDKKVIKIQKFT